MKHIFSHWLQSPTPSCFMSRHSCLCSFILPSRALKALLFQILASSSPPVQSQVIHGREIHPSSIFFFGFQIVLGTHYVRRVVLNWRWVTPPGDIWQGLETFLVVATAGKGCCWHPVGTGQECCWTSYNAQDSPAWQTYLAQNVNCAEIEKPYFRVTELKSFPLGVDVYEQTHFLKI